MSISLNQRSPVARVGWLIPVLMLAWVAFLFLPLRPPPPAVSAPLRLVVRPPSKLEQVGLANNPDLEALPQLFAVYADAAEWKDDRTFFAYWHPGVKAYAYFFEATRGPGGYRFREIPEPRIVPEEEFVGALEADESDAEISRLKAGERVYWWDDSLGDDCPIRFLHRLSSPLMKSQSIRLKLSDEAFEMDNVDRARAPLPAVKPESTQLQPQPPRR